MIQPKYTREGLMIYKLIEDRSTAAGAGDPRSILKAKEVLSIFERIPADELRLLGMDPRHARPEWMMI